MKRLFRVMSVLLVFCMLFSVVACGKDTVTDDATTNGADSTSDTVAEDNTADKYADIAGEYLLDAAELGMPMKWYIKITADGKFQISTTRDYAALKGEGTVGDKDGTYMLVYSDSTSENPKSATFKFEGKNMVFSTNVPIGAASVSPKEDEGIFPTAKVIANEDIIGTYLGTYEKQSAMAGNVLYSYELVLGIGNEYGFSSSFAMMGKEYTRIELGTYEVNGAEISFTATSVDGEKVETPTAVKGSIADKTVKAAFKLSVMASEAQEIEAKYGVYADYAGTYAGVYQKTMGPTMSLNYGIAMVLDAFGGYEYVSCDSEDATKINYTEKGTYTVENGKFSFKSDKDGAVAVEGKLENYMLTTKLPISSMMSTPVDVTFYSEQVSGMFAALGEDADKKFGASISLGGNCFILSVVDEKQEVCYIAMGTFEIKGGMMTTLNLTTTALFEDAEMTKAVTDIPAELKTVSAPVADSGINAELPFDLDDSKLIGFQFEKVS